LGSIATFCESKTPEATMNAQLVVDINSKKEKSRFVKTGPSIFGLNESFVAPEKVAKAIPNLLKNTTDDKINTTVIKWCAAFGLAEIAKHNPKTRKQLLPIFEKIIKSEKNNGVKNVYVKALKAIEKEKKI